MLPLKADTCFVFLYCNQSTALVSLFIHISYNTYPLYNKSTFLFIYRSPTLFYQSISGLTFPCILDLLPPFCYFFILSHSGTISPQFFTIFLLGWLFPPADNWNHIKLLVPQMQNQMTYTPYQLKPFAQGQPKTMDRSIPVLSPKHSASNPNLSFEYNNKSLFESRGNDHRGLPMAMSPNSHNTRPRHDLSKSVMLPQPDSRPEIPEDILSPKKDILTRNVGKRSTRTSEFNIQQSQPFSNFSSKRQQTAPLNNFGKAKEEQEKRERQPPGFLGRNDLKRSMVLQGTYERMQSPPPFISQRKESMKQRKPFTCQDFVKIRELGNGKYGRVSLVYEKYTGFVCALKMIQKKLLKEEEITQQFLREVKIQMFLNHPNIVKMYGCFEDATNIYIILEVGMGGQLFHQIKKSLPLPQPRTAFIMKQVIQAVNEIHSHRIIHRDIKPQNIVVHENVLKLCDFGWSVHQDNKLRTTFCGTPLYVCPQILKGNEYDQKIDIWSIGIMMYQMLVGENPFRITKEEQLVKIVKDEIKIPSYLVLSPQTRDFLDRCLQKNPENRASIKQLLNHPFFKRFQQKSDKSKPAGDV